VETDLRTRLLADAAVAALVGTRVDWGLRVQGGPLPALRLTLIPTPRAYTMAGADTTQQYRVQVDCYGETYKAAYDLRAAVVAEMEPASGEFLGSFVERDFDNSERTDAGVVHCRTLEFKITHIPA
jgi:hypothetical protein